MKKEFVIILIVVQFTMIPVQTAYAVSLEFAVPAMQSGVEQLQQWSPIIDYLETYCGFDITLNIVKDHAELYRGLCDKYYDIGFMNAYWVERTEMTNNLTMSASAVIDHKESFTTAIIVHKDSFVRILQDLSGKYFAMTIPEESLGGYVIPTCMLHEAGLVPEELFGQIIYSGNYTSILKGVAFGAVDAGAVTMDVLEDESNAQYSRQVRVIAKSEEIPQWALVSQTGVKQPMIDIFIDGITHMHNSAEGEQLLNAVGYDQFNKTGVPTIDLDHKYISFMEEQHETAK